jgi:hypothetical protein
MKKLFLGIVASLAGVSVCQAQEVVDTVYEDAPSANVFGVLKVVSSEVETAISVPWLNVGGGDISASNLVYTANLNAGDVLFVYTGDKSYKAWAVVEKTPGVKTWEPMTEVSASGSDYSVAQDSASRAFARGSGLFLKRSAPLAEAIYLHGQKPETTAGETAMTLGGYTLFAPPSVAAVDLNDPEKVAWDWGEATPATGDEVKIPIGSTGVFLTYKWTKVKVDGTWKLYRLKKMSPVYDASLPAGRGAWYVSGAQSQTAPVLRWL